MKVFAARKHSDIPQGQQLTINNRYTIFNTDVDVLRDDGSTLAIFRKGVIKDPAIINAGRKLMRYKVKTRSRGMAAGINASNKKVNPNGGLGAGNMVASAIVGYTEANGFYKCRQTMLYKKHKEVFDTETMKLLDYVTDTYRRFAPDAYQKQSTFIDKVNPHMRLGQSVFTTITVNVDFRTMTHTDRGDYHSGLGNLLVFQTGDYTGAELMMPEYEVAFKIEEGDILLFDVHELHCNNAINGSGRISLVCYAREKILDKCSTTTPEELTQNSSIYGVDRSRKATRKKKTE